MIAVFLLLLAAVALFLAYRHWRRSEQTPRGLGVYAERVAAADVGVPLVPEKIWRGHRKVPEVLSSRRFGLVGKPDYVLVDDDGMYFPVELKNRRAPRQPLESDVAQLWSYCFLLEENGFPTIGGEIRYRNRTFQMPYSPESRNLVLELLEDLRRYLREPDTARVPQNPGPQCRNCAYRHNCESAIQIEPSANFH